MQNCKSIFSLYRNLEKRIATMLAEFLPEALRNELDACIGYSAVDPLKLEVNFRYDKHIISEG